MKHTSVLLPTRSPATLERWIFILNFSIRYFLITAHHELYYTSSTASICQDWDRKVECNSGVYYGSQYKDMFHRLDKICA